MGRALISLTRVIRNSTSPDFEWLKKKHGYSRNSVLFFVWKSYIHLGSLYATHGKGECVSQLIVSIGAIHGKTYGIKFSFTKVSRVTLSVVHTWMLLFTFSADDRAVSYISVWLNRILRCQMQLTWFHILNIFKNYGVQKCFCEMQSDLLEQ